MAEWSIASLAVGELAANCWFLANEEQKEALRRFDDLMNGRTPTKEESGGHKKKGFFNKKDSNNN